MHELQVVLASRDDVKALSGLLTDMQKERAEFAVTLSQVRDNIEHSWGKGVFWFLFKGAGEPVGCCYLSPIYMYFTPYPYYYMGGAYLDKMYRGRGLFKKSVESLKHWVARNGGGYLMAHIHHDNKQSHRAFVSSGFSSDMYQVLATDLIKPKT